MVRLRLVLGAVHPIPLTLLYRPPSNSRIMRSMSFTMKHREIQYNTHNPRNTKQSYKQHTLRPQVSIVVVVILKLTGQTLPPTLSHFHPLFLHMIFKSAPRLG
jgi:hypothetical protein